MKLHSGRVRLAQEGIPYTGDQQDYFDFLVGRLLRLADAGSVYSEAESFIRGSHGIREYEDFIRSLEDFTYSAGEDTNKVAGKHKWRKKEQPPIKKQMEKMKARDSKPKPFDRDAYLMSFLRQKAEEFGVAVQDSALKRFVRIIDAGGQDVQLLDEKGNLFAELLRDSVVLWGARGKSVHFKVVAEEFVPAIRKAESGPFPDDIVISSNGFKYTVGSEDHGYMGEFVEWDDAVKTIKKWMAQENWYPDVWFRDDHGGLELRSI